VKIELSGTDEMILSELGQRLARTRIEHQLTQAQLAEQAGLSRRTVERMEKGRVALQLSGFIRICRVLGLLERFDLLLPEPVPSPLEQLKRRGRERKRASPKGTQPPGPRPWRWGDES
jgi:transcriptional regulator with XRE-family HTH domain